MIRSIFSSRHEGGNDRCDCYFVICLLKIGVDLKRINKIKGVFFSFCVMISELAEIRYNVEARSMAIQFIDDIGWV